MQQEKEKLIKEIQKEQEQINLMISDYESDYKKVEKWEIYYHTECKEIETLLEDIDAYKTVMEIAQIKGFHIALTPIKNYDKLAAFNGNFITPVENKHHDFHFKETEESELKAMDNAKLKEKLTSIQKESIKTKETYTQLQEEQKDLIEPIQDFSKKYEPSIKPIMIEIRDDLASKKGILSSTIAAQTTQRIDTIIAEQKNITAYVSHRENYYPLIINHQQINADLSYLITCCLNETSFLDRWLERPLVVFRRELESLKQQALTPTADRKGEGERQITYSCFKARLLFVKNIIDIFPSLPKIEMKQKITDLLVSLDRSALEVRDIHSNYHSQSQRKIQELNEHKTNFSKFKLNNKEDLNCALKELKSAISDPKPVSFDFFKEKILLVELLLPKFCRSLEEESKSSDTSDTLNSEIETNITHINQALRVVTPTESKSGPLESKSIRLASNEASIFHQAHKMLREKKPSPVAKGTPSPSHVGER